MIDQECANCKLPWLHHGCGDVCLRHTGLEPTFWRDPRAPEPEAEGALPVPVVDETEALDAAHAAQILAVQKMHMRAEQEHVAAIKAERDLALARVAGLEAREEAASAKNAEIRTECETALNWLTRQLVNCGDDLDELAAVSLDKKGMGGLRLDLRDAIKATVALQDRVAELTRPKDADSGEAGSMNEHGRGSAAPPRTYLERLRDQAYRGGVFITDDGPVLRVPAWADVRLLLDAADLLERIRAWDQLPETADGPYWLKEIDAVLARLDRGASSDARGLA